jgi:transposase-like protein
MRLRRRANMQKHGAAPPAAPAISKDSLHPESCPWCSGGPVYGINPSPDDDRHYRCAACGTAFFMHTGSASDRDRHRIR